MGANNGSGCPMWLKCAKRYRAEGTHYRSGGFNLVATGRTRPARRKGGARMTNREIEYQCLDCHHVGWSRHMDAERLLAQRRP